MSFVISHPDIEGTAVIAEQALPAYASKGWVLEDRTDSTAPTPDRPELEQPNRSDSAAKWRTYAVASGMPYEEATAATRDDLADKYNPAPKPDPTPAPSKPGTPGKTTQES